MILFLFILSNAIVAALCAWAVLSRRVNDGLIGKLLLTLLCVSAVSCIYWANEAPWTVDRSEAIFSIAVAGMAIRCWGLRTFWPPVRRAYKRKMAHLHALVINRK